MTKYTPNERVKCLHCQTVVRLEATDEGEDWMKVFAPNEKLRIKTAQCPECKRAIVTREKLGAVPNAGYVIVAEYVVWPLSSGRLPAPPEVPEDIAQDYNEASIVSRFSAKASAALSRRCLQTLLRDAAKTKAKDLSKQIEEVIPSLPSYISVNLDAVRQIGNFAAHEQKSRISDEIIEVEPGEAEWNLDVLESLFDFYYVRPKIEQKKREQLNEKLKEMGKPPLKLSPEDISDENRST